MHLPTGQFCLNVRVYISVYQGKGFLFANSAIFVQYRPENNQIINMCKRLIKQKIFKQEIVMQAP